MDAGGAKTAPSRPHTLAVQLLGSFRVTIDGRPVPETLWRSAKATMLVTYLAYRVGTPLSPDHVLTTLWPELDPRTEQNHLHKAVHLARQTFSAMLGVEGRDVIAFRQGRYALLADVLQVDAVQFKQAIFDARWATKLGDAPATQRHLEEAARLYSGDLLADDYVSDWIRPERERLRQDYSDTLRSLAAIYQREGDTARTAQVYGRLLTVEPCAEDAYRALIAAALQAGRRGEAVRLYQEYQDRLRRELDLAPNPELEQLIRSA